RNPRPLQARHGLGWRRRQHESLELLYVPARAVADFHAFGCQFERRNGDHALFRRPQYGKAVIALLMTQATAVAPTRPSYAKTSPLPCRVRCWRSSVGPPDPVRATGKRSTEVDLSSPSLFLDRVCNDGQA